MSQPRLIIPGATYLLTRRTLRRHMLLRPDPAITQLIVYSLAVAANRFDIRVHALCAMSTHLHLVVTDVRGMLPSFLAFSHRLIALGVKLLRKWEGPVWDHEPTSVVRLLTQEAVVQKIAYVLANPVAAGLVRQGREWPGAKVRIDDLGSVLRAKRPAVYFDSTNPAWPDEVILPVPLPPDFDEGNPNRRNAEAFRREVAGELEQQEQRARAAMQSQGHRFLGAERASKVAPEARATSFEPRRKLNPMFAVGRGHADAAKLAATILRAFRAAYRAALDRWRAGVRSVVFPVGTWWMRVFHRVTTGEEVAVAA